MDRSADYVILGAGIAGMTMRHMLAGESVVLLDGAPGRYKIGESIIPQHFMEPEVRPLYEIVRRLPSATPKDGTLFIADASVGGFEPFVETNFTVHVARQDLEAATAKFFGTEIVEERVEAVDIDARTVKTDRGTFVANKVIIDCSGPARLVARSLGLAREVWPVWASWAYHDVVDVDDQRLFDVLRRGDKAFFRYNERLRRVEPSDRYEGFRPSRCTNLTHVGDGMWTWQIPLFNATRLSVGVVSRHGPVSAEQYREVVARSIAPQYRTRLREWDRSGPFNSFHVRNRFAWAADRFAGDSWALVGDAAFFGDPVYSVGTGFATNSAIQLGRALRDGGWSPARAAAHHRLTADLYARAKRAYDWWYFGKVVTDPVVAEEIQTNFLNGRAFQVETLGAYSEMWLVSHPQDAWNAADPGRGEDVTPHVRSLLEEGGVLVGWRLAATSAFAGRLNLEWERPDASPLGLTLERVVRGRPYYRAIGDLGLRYRRPPTASGELDGQARALVAAFTERVAREPQRFVALMADTGPTASASRRESGKPRLPRDVRRVGVVGGGTAGYLTALALRRRYPELSVTLLESSRIPVIGVGEATTPDLVEFLHGALGVDELELHREVRPTWKLGIRFLWGEPGGSFFHHPFVGEHLLEACSHAHDQDLQSLSAQLMRRGLAPVLREPDGRIEPLLRTTPYAYHLDNPRFVGFLQRLAARYGVEHVDCTIDAVGRAADGGVDHLRTSDGRSLSFDLYVDATGFRSLLLGETLGVPFQSYASSLLCDTAVFAGVPHGGALDPFTLAETMEAGWCWNIPQVDENHRGYVFASSHISPDRAEAEMRAKNQGMSAARVVRFRSGRLAECWVKNVVGMGNAYAFVEPLESTALHMLVHQIGLLVDALSADEAVARETMNASVGAHWDCLRGFLALHYRFNRKLDTPFWKTCRAEVDLADGQAMLEAFQAGAPLVARPDRKTLENALFRTGFFGLLGVDNVLLGQKVPTRLLPPGPGVPAFERWVGDELPAILSRALPHREALDAYAAWLGERGSSGERPC